MPQPSEGSDEPRGASTLTSPYIIHHGTEDTVMGNQHGCTVMAWDLLLT